MYSSLNLGLLHVAKRSNEFNLSKYEVHINNYMTRSFTVLLLIWDSSKNVAVVCCSVCKEEVTYYAKGTLLLRSLTVRFALIFQ